MTCSEIMTTDPVTVREDQPVAAATAVLRDNLFRSVPVVDADGKMVGQFGIQALLGLILPKAAMADDGLSNLRYLNDDLADLQRRLVEEHDQPVGKYAEDVGAVQLHVAGRSWQLRDVLQRVSDVQQRVGLDRVEPLLGR